MFREALMLGSLCDNVYLDTSSSNSWVRYSGLTLEEVYGRALEVLGPDKLLFGTDSSWFPRGWQRPVWEEQCRVMEGLGLDEKSRQKIQCLNFDRIFPVAH